MRALCSACRSVRQQTEVAIAGGAQEPVGARDRKSGAPHDCNRPQAVRSSEAVDPNIRRLEEELREKLGARVDIKHARAGHGQLVIRYNNLEELDGILSHFQLLS